MIPETSESEPEVLRPVLFYIQGGSFKHGNNTGDIWSNQFTMYDDRFLSITGNFMSINYRMNSFGLFTWKGRDYLQIILFSLVYSSVILQGDAGRSIGETEINGKEVIYDYEDFRGNLMVYDAE